jgi:hypothetical protein
MSGVFAMKAVRVLTWLAVIAAVFAPGFLRLDGQEAIPAHKSNTFRLTIAMEKERVPVGESPKALLTVKNLTDHVIQLWSCAAPPTLVWIQGEHGEPPTTAWGRGAMGRLLPGEPELMCTLNLPFPLAPGDTTTHGFILDAFYDLHEPGKYKVYLDFPSEEGLLRTDTVTFEVIAADPAKDKKTQ